MTPNINGFDTARIPPLSRSVPRRVPRRPYEAISRRSTSTRSTAMLPRWPSNRIAPSSPRSTPTRAPSAGTGESTHSLLRSSHTSRRVDEKDLADQGASKRNAVKRRSPQIKSYSLMFGESYSNRQERRECQPIFAASRHSALLDGARRRVSARWGRTTSQEELARTRHARAPHRVGFDSTRAATSCRASSRADRVGAQIRRPRPRPRPCQYCEAADGCPRCCCAAVQGGGGPADRQLLPRCREVLPSSCLYSSPIAAAAAAPPPAPRRGRARSRAQPSSRASSTPCRALHSRAVPPRARAPAAVSRGRARNARPERADGRGVDPRKVTRRERRAVVRRARRCW